VPFLIRAGKCLPLKTTEVRVALRRPPQQVFAGIEIEPAREPNYLRFRLGADAEIGLGARAKTPGSGLRGASVELSVCANAGIEHEPYERLLGDALRGDAALFARADEVDESWRIVEPLLGDSRPAHAYEPGTWGPAEADELARAAGGWHAPGERPCF
jgi:glucose-6-phosphate 1-dehydrogenase